MLSYLELNNFKSFSNVTFDLRKAYNQPKKIAFIYGENGSGKSNLISSLLFLTQTQNTLGYQMKLGEAKSLDDLKLIKNDEAREEVLRIFMESRYRSLERLIESYKMISTSNNESMSLKIGFRIEDKDGSYYMKFSNNEIIKEELRYQINEREGLVLSIEKNKKPILSPSIFIDNNYKKELLDSVEKYWGKNTFLSILTYERELKNEKFIKNRINQNLFDVLKWLNHLSVYCKQCDGDAAHISIPFEILKDLEEGNINQKDSKELKACEKALNIFFTRLYSDIKKVYYKIEHEKDTISYELYFKKQLNNKLLDIPFSLESTGTQKLLEYFPMLFSCLVGASVFIDEIDNGIHDLLMKTVLESLYDIIEGQLIVTTHNTLLMESMGARSTDSIYIIHSDSMGNKSIRCLSDYKERTQKTNNIRNKYLRGDYEGIPFVGDLDFDEIYDEFEALVPDDQTNYDNGDKNEI